MAFKSLEDVEFVESEDKVLGEGGFSQVRLVRLKNNKKLYALKCIDMKKISSVHNNNLRKEIKIHQSLRHPHIIRFEGAVQVEHMVYIMLEYADNGALFFFINPRTGMSEKFAFKFFYQTALALEYLHSKGIMHRDIKPENILLDRNYDSKLCDFGWCAEHGAHLPDDESICGTYEYMPPEIVYEKSHNKEVDIWAIGVLLYELIHGRAPYTAESLDDIKERMKQTEITFKKSLSSEAKDLLLKLLKFEPSERITLEQIFTHPFILKHLDEYENNKESFKYIPPEPEWDNDLDIYLNGEMTGAADNAMAELKALDERRKFEDELLNDPEKQQIYIKKQLQEGKISSSDRENIEKVCFFRDEAGNLKMRLIMKDRPQPMRGNSEKKNSLARTRGSEKFQKIVGPQSPPKAEEIQGAKKDTPGATQPTDQSKTSNAANPSAPGFNPSSIPVSSQQGNESLQKKLEPLSITKPQPFNVLHGGPHAEEASKHPQGAGFPSTTFVGVRDPKQLVEDRLNIQSVGISTQHPLKLISQPPNNAIIESPIKITAQPTNTPAISTAGQALPIPKGGPIPLEAGHQLPQTTGTFFPENRFKLNLGQGNFPDQSPITSPEDSQTPGASPYAATYSRPLLLHQTSSKQQESKAIVQNEPQGSTVLRTEPLQQTTPIKSPLLLTKSNEVVTSHNPHSAKPVVDESSGKTGPIVISAGQTTLQSTKVQPNFVESSTAHKLISSPSKASNQQYDATMAPNPYFRPAEQAPALQKLDSPTKDRPVQTPAVGHTQEAPVQSPSRPPLTQTLTHNRSLSNYQSTVKIGPTIETTRPPGDAPNEGVLSLQNKPAEPQQATWTRYEPGKPIYLPKYAPENTDALVLNSTFTFAGPQGKPPTGPPAPLADKRTGPSDQQTELGQVQQRPSPQATPIQQSSSGYRPLTRSVSRKDHSANYTPPSSIPRFPTETKQDSYMSYEVNSRQHSKTQPDMFLPSPESGNLKRHLISMGDKRFGMTVDETARNVTQREEFNTSLSYNNFNRFKMEASNSKPDDKGKGSGPQTADHPPLTVFKPSGNLSLIQGSQSRYGIVEPSKKPNLLSQKGPLLQQAKVEVRQVLQEASQNKSSFTSKFITNSTTSSPRDMMRNGSSIKDTINKNDLTLLQNDTSPVKMANAHNITTLLNDSLAKTTGQTTHPQQQQTLFRAQDTKPTPGAIVIRSGPSGSEGMKQIVQTTQQTSGMGSTTSTTNYHQESKGLGHYESSSTSLRNDIGSNFSWNQSRPNLDHSGILRGIPSSNELMRTEGGSFHDNHGSFVTKSRPSIQNRDNQTQPAGITINSRKNSTKEGELPNKLRDMHGNELRHNTQSPLVYKPDRKENIQEVQNFGIYEDRNALERSKSQSNARGEVLSNQLGTKTLTRTPQESITSTAVFAERKSLSGSGDVHRRLLDSGNDMTYKAGGSSIPLVLKPSPLPGSTTFIPETLSKQRSGVAEGPSREVEAITTFRYSQTQGYPRFDLPGPGSLHKTFTEPTSALPEKQLVSIYKPTATHVQPLSKEEPLGSKPRENYDTVGSVKYDYGASSAPKPLKYGQTSPVGLVENKADNSQKTQMVWNRASIPGPSTNESTIYKLGTYTVSQALNTSSPLITMKDYEGLRTAQPLTNSPQTGNKLITHVGSSSNTGQPGSTVGGLTLVGRTSSSSAGLPTFQPVSSASVSGNTGPVPISSGTLKVVTTPPNTEPRPMTVIYSSGSSLGGPTQYSSSKPSLGGQSHQPTTTIYSSKGRSPLSPQTSKVLS